MPQAISGNNRSRSIHNKSHLSGLKLLRPLSLSLFNKKIKQSVLVYGAQETEVEEPILVARSVLFEFEIDDVAEPKVLLAGDLQKLVSRFGSIVKAAVAIGASEAFVRQKIKGSRRRFPRKHYHDLDEEK